MTITTHNWAGNVELGAAHIHTPTSLAELRKIVAGARRVRALGTGHSFSRVAATDADLVSLAGMPAAVEVAADGRTATVSAAMRYGEVATALHEAGYALANLASLPHISVAGACATGTHGSGAANGSLATSVAGIEMVTGGGDLLRLRRGELEFSGTVVALGALGVVTGLTLDIEPAYEVSQVVYDDLAFDDFDLDVFAEGYSVSAFTDWAAPRFTQVWVKRRGAGGFPERLRGAARAGGPRHPIAALDGTICTAQLGEPGPWHERLPHFRLDHTPSVGEELQSEYFVDRVRGLEVIAALHAVSAAFAHLVAVTELRTVAADELWLSPAYRRHSMTIHFTWVDDIAGVTAALPVIEEALAPYAPRPHWGKLFTMAPERVAAGYERLADFGRMRRIFDPAGTFGNDFVDAYAPVTPSPAV
ncbi:MAG TPA: FAD-binding protein [Micromonosporaceae bacterium]|nr:FAD-binding protein [Micromonosporaceae bacterium]